MTEYNLHQQTVNTELAIQLALASVKGSEGYLGNLPETSPFSSLLHLTFFLLHLPLIYTDIDAACPTAEHRQA
jgi:hypothetical protein